jgi:hypothetical protein
MHTHTQMTGRNCVSEAPHSPAGGGSWGLNSCYAPRPNRRPRVRTAPAWRECTLWSTVVDASDASGAPVPAAPCSQAARLRRAAIARLAERTPSPQNARTRPDESVPRRSSACHGPEVCCRSSTDVRKARRWLPVLPLAGGARRRAARVIRLVPAGSQSGPQSPLQPRPPAAASFVVPSGCGRRGQGPFALASLVVPSGSGRSAQGPFATPLDPTAPPSGLPARTPLRGERRHPAAEYARATRAPLLTGTPFQPIGPLPPPAGSRSVIQVVNASPLTKPLAVVLPFAWPGTSLLARGGAPTPSVGPRSTARCTPRQCPKRCPYESSCARTAHWTPEPSTHLALTSPLQKPPTVSFPS